MTEGIRPNATDLVVNGTVSGTLASSRADRFLDSFRSLEAQIRLLAHVGPEVPFGTALRSACGPSPELRRYEGELRHFAMLRNAIVHEPYEGGEPIADPREETVAEIEAVVSGVLEPPTALSVLKHPVTFANGRMQVKAAAVLMLERNFSQLPVVDDGRVTDILTSGAVARYLTSVLLEDGAADDPLEVSAVVPYDEDREFVLEPGDATVLTVVEDFARCEEAGRALNAVCLMGEGLKGLLGIATVYDLPALLQASRPYR